MIQSRIKRNQKVLSNIELPNYKIKQCSTESASGRSILYIKGNTIYKVRDGLKTSKMNNLQYIFIEKISTNTTNISVGRIYCHPIMGGFDFKQHFVRSLN